MEDERKKYQKEWQLFNERKEVWNGMEELKRTIEVKKPNLKSWSEGKMYIHEPDASKIQAAEKSDTQINTSEAKGRSTEGDERNETKGRKWRTK